MILEWILFLLTPVIGGLIYGIERVVRARMQNRQGPPILQPFYDMFKLIDKRAMIVHPTHIILGVMHFVTLWIVVGFIIFGGNLLYVVFLHLLSTIFLVLAGFSVRSIFSHVGANRELMAIVAYEPILIFVAVGFYMINGSFDISVIRSSGSEILPLFLLFLAFLVIVPVKLKKSPFDAVEAHQEIVGGVEIEYSGVFYEILYMAKWVEYIFIYALLVLFAGDSLIFATILALGVFLVVNLVDNSTARIRIDSMVKVVLTLGLVLGGVNLIGLSFV
ncbi:MAG: NADH-quinone oxidoreductase subunit H [Campylobacterales bacterium]|nr:NADH-quinone oxidoreductase subunit H [Campylobacterales bacterium]